MKHLADTISTPSLIDIINKTKDRLSFIDKNYIYRVANQAYVKDYKKPIEKIIGHPVWEVMGIEAFKNIVKPKLDRALEGEEVHYEAWFDFPDIPRAYLFVTYCPSFELNGEVVGIIVTVTDMTKRKQLEEEKEFYEKLMFDQSRMAQIGEMIAFIAHQWRGSLHTLSTYLLRLRMEMQECATVSQIELFNRCEYLFEQLSSHIEDVNSLYAQDNQNDEIKLDISVNQAVALLQPRLRAENIHVKISIPEECFLSVNRSNLLHVFVVFLENGIDALSQISEPDKQITINAVCDGHSIIINICDNGDGVGFDVADTIFDAGISTKSAAGHGYGLYFAHKIITSHLGGTIDLIPNDKGAWFRIVLPKTSWE